MSVPSPLAPLATARLFEYCVAIIDLRDMTVTPEGTPVPSLNTLGYYGWELLHVVLTGNLQQGLGFFRRDLITTPGPGVPLTLTALEPDFAYLGSPSFTMRILGTGFTPETVLIWNGSDDVCVFISETELTTTINMSTAEVAVAVTVAVRNEIEITEPLTFEFLPAP